MSESAPQRRLSLRERTSVRYFRGAKGDSRTPHDAKFQMISLESNRIVVDELQIADSLWSRFVGLQFRRELPVGHGLLLIPCRSIHTFWMRFAIDVIFLDADGTVLDVRSAVRPWRTTASRHGRPHATLELAAGCNPLCIGERVQVIGKPRRGNSPASTASTSPFHPIDIQPASEFQFDSLKVEANSC